MFSERRPAVLQCAMVAVILISAARPALLRGQSERLHVAVTDELARPVAFALVALGSGISRVADDSGRVVFLAPSSDSVRLHVRRIGFSPFIGWARKESGTDLFKVALTPLIVRLDTVKVRAERNSALARTGFYDRVQRVQRGAFAARMITPEELDERNPIAISQILAGESMVKVTPLSGRRVILRGRGATCGMTVLLDGMRVTGMVEELLDVGPGRRPPDPRMLLTVDELVSAASVAAIEIYGSSISAPAELLQVAGLKSCGIVAIWTGARK